MMLKGKDNFDLYNNDKLWVRIGIFSVTLFGSYQLMNMNNVHAATTQKTTNQSTSVAQPISNDNDNTQGSSQIVLKSTQTDQPGESSQPVATKIGSATTMQDVSNIQTKSAAQPTPTAATEHAEIGLTTTGTVTTPDGSPKKVADSGDTITWHMDGYINTADSNVKKVNPNNKISIQYTLDHNLEYESSQVILNGVVQNITPKNTPHGADSYLTWEITPPSLDDQAARDISYNIQLVTKLKEGLLDVPTFQPIVRPRYQETDGTWIEKSNVAVAVPLVIQYILYDTNGQSIIPTTFNIYDGDGNLVALAVDKYGVAVNDLSQAEIIGLRTFVWSGKHYKVAETHTISYEGRQFQFEGFTDDSLPLAGTYIDSSSNPHPAIRMIYREVPRSGTINVNYVLVNEDNQVVTQGFNETLTGQEGKDYTVIPASKINYDGKEYEYQNPTSNSADLTGRYTADDRNITLVYVIHTEAPEQPNQPVQPNRPTQPTQPNETKVPNQPNEPVQPTQPIQPNKSMVPNHENQPGKIKQSDSSRNRHKSSQAASVAENHRVGNTEAKSKGQQANNEQQAKLPQMGEQRTESGLFIGIVGLILSLLNVLGIRKRRV